MIARLWHGETAAAKAGAYARYVRRTGVRDCRATPGNRGVWLLQRRDGRRAHFLMISLWHNLAAVRKFSGPSMERARYYPRDREFLKKTEPTVTHYEVCA